MKRFGKVTMWVGVGLVVVVLALVLVVKLVLTPERVRATVLPLAEKSLQRKVDLGTIEISLFSGIRLDGLKVYEADGREVFAAVDGVVLSYRFWPLFSGKVIVDEIGIERPTIQIVRFADGHFNFDGIGAQEGAEAPAPAAPEAAAAGKPLDLSVARIDLHDGTVRYRDFALNPQQPFELAITALAIHARDVALDRPFPLSIDAKVADAPLNLALTVDPAAKVGAGTVKLAELDLATFRPIAGPDYPAHIKPLTLSLDLKVAGGAEEASVSGAVIVRAGEERVRLQLAAPQLLAKPLSVTLDVAAEQLTVDRLLPPAHATAKGAAKPAASAAAVEPGPFDLPLKAQGSVRIGKLVYEQKSINDFILEWGLDGNVLTVKRFAGQVAGGRFDCNARVDLRRKGLAYTSHLGVDGVQAGALVEMFAPQGRGVITMPLDLQFDLQGAGTLPENLKRNLSGKGELVLGKGEISGSALTDKYAELFKSDKLRTLRFDESRFSLLIERGAVIFDGKLEGSSVKLAPKGSVTLDGGLDLQLATRLAPALMDEIGSKGVTRYLRDKEGWGVVPLKLKGSVSEPVFTLDSSAASAQATEQLQQRLERSLEKRLQKNRQKNGEKQQLLDGALKGLLGR